MRPTLLALAILSTFAISQNVLAIASAPRAEAAFSAVAPGLEPQLLLSHASIGPVAPGPGSLSLFVAGLAGLTAAGGRRHDRESASA